MLRVTLSVGLTATLLSCSAVPSPTVGVPANRSELPDGVLAVVQCPAQCFPSGTELCGNLLDDDCDGLADEGCGSEAAASLVALQWDEPQARLSLLVIGPDGERARQDATTASGLVLSAKQDAKRRGSPSPLWVSTSGRPPAPGRYRITVRLEEPGSAPELHLTGRLSLGPQPRCLAARLDAAHPEASGDFGLR